MSEKDRKKAGKEKNIQENGKIKKKFPLFKILIWIAIIMDIAAVAAGVIMQEPEVDYTYKYVNSEIVSHSWLDAFSVGSYIYMGVVVLLLIVAIVHLVMVRNKLDIPFVRNTIMTSLLIPVSVVVVFFSKVLVTDINVNYEPCYFEFSKDGHDIVICERAWGYGGYGDVYQIEDDGTAYKIGAFTTDNGYRNEGNYTFEWTQDGVTVHFTYDSSGTKAYLIAEWVE